MLTNLNSIFIYDELLHSDLLAAVLGEKTSRVIRQTAHVAHDVLNYRSDIGTLAQKDRIQGVILSPMSRNHSERLAFYYAVFGAFSIVGEAQTASGITSVKMYYRSSNSDADLRLRRAFDEVGDDLESDLGLVLRLVNDVMALYGQIGAAETAVRLPRMRARAQSAYIAQAAVARGVGLEMTRDLVQRRALRQPYSCFLRSKNMICPSKNLMAHRAQS